MYRNPASERYYAQRDLSINNSLKLREYLVTHRDRLVSRPGIEAASSSIQMPWLLLIGLDKTFPLLH
jgi:hypothetical protein